MEEIRRQRRIPLSAEAKVIKLSSGDRYEAELVNISNYGARLKTTALLKTNERIKASMTLNKQDQVVYSEEVPGTVRYVERTMKFYSAGIQFNTKINDTGFPIFNQYLEYLKTRE
ncbi:MAG: hypothetical protein GQ522_02850 [Deltaproteobacteria bacterium]|nr:hypothetical protein [Deltaproteobacteria bacterium]